MAGGLVVIFILTLVLFSLYQAGRVQKEIGVITPLQKEQETVSAPALRQKITPGRPEDYGMIVRYPEEEPLKTQAEWDRYFAERIKELKTRTSPETWDKMKQKVNEKPGETKAAMMRLEEAMKKYEEELKKNPQDKELQKKMQNLMMLKSIQKELSASK